MQPCRGKSQEKSSSDGRRGPYPGRPTGGTGEKAQTQTKSPGAPWCAGAVLLDWSHSLIPCIRCMRIRISRTCDGEDPLRCESGFSDPIDRIFQGLPLDLGIVLKRGVECYPGICVSSSIRFAFLTRGWPAIQVCFGFHLSMLCRRLIRGSLPQHPYGLRSNFVWVDLLRSVRKTFCVGFPFQSLPKNGLNRFY